MHETENGMLREDKAQKPNYLDYFTPEVMERYGRHMKKGEIKHGRGNWKKGGYPKHEYLESAFRHLLALWKGDTSEDHAAALLFNAVGFMHEEHLKDTLKTRLDALQSPQTHAETEDVG